jgi:hypothetical protein
MTLVNTAAYVYSINVLFSHPQRPTIVFVDKARHHADSNKSYYRLKYDKDVGLFAGDEKIPKSEVVRLVAETKKYES